MKITARAIYACDPCEMIGPVERAMRHERDTGHRTRVLSREEEIGVREIWLLEGRCLLCGSPAHQAQECP